MFQGHGAVAKCIRWLSVGAVLAAPLLAATPVQGEIIPLQRMMRGVSSTPAQCARHAYAVWVMVSGQGFCIRYYLSTAGGEGDRPLVWLSGDKLGRYNFKTRQFTPNPNEKDVDTGRLEKLAENLSKGARTTAIYLARVGIDGSSGFHGIRRSWLELYVINAALDAIKQRHGFSGFHIAGQSGGAGLIGGLLALRADFGCAVPGAGRLALLRKPKPSDDPDLEFFDASEGIAIIAGRRHTRIIVVTDPEDKRVKVEHQVTFVQQLRAAGGQVEQFFVQATDELRHGVSVYTRYVAAACVRGMSNEQIAQGLAGVQERHIAAAEERERRRRMAGAPGAPGSPAGAPAGQPPRRASPYAQPAPQQPYPRYAQPAPQQGQPSRPQFTRPVPPPSRTPRHAQPAPQQGQPSRPQFTRPVPPPSRTPRHARPAQPAPQQTQPSQPAPRHAQPAPVPSARTAFGGDLPPRKLTN